jgi:hypothetical protein
MKSRPASQWEASRETEIEEETTLIPPLYAAFAHDATIGNLLRYRKVLVCEK